MLNLFKITSWLEGLSYLALLFIAMPIKYLGNDEQYVKMLGMPHGILFVLYVALAFVLKSEFKWDNKTFRNVLLASIIPFGTFYVGKYLRK